MNVEHAIRIDERDNSKINNQNSVNKQWNYKNKKKNNV